MIIILWEIVSNVYTIHTHWTQYFIIPDYSFHCYVIRWELFRFHILIYNKPTQYIHTHDTHTWCVLFCCVCDVIKCHYVIPLVLLVQRITPSVLPLKNKLWFLTTTLICCTIPAFQGILERASPNRKLNKRRMKIKQSYVVITKMLYL